MSEPLPDNLALELARAEIKRLQDHVMVIEKQRDDYKLVVDIVSGALVPYLPDLLVRACQSGYAAHGNSTPIKVILKNILSDWKD